MTTDPKPAAKKAPARAAKKAPARAAKKKPAAKKKKPAAKKPEAATADPAPAPAPAPAPFKANLTLPSCVGQVVKVAIASIADDWAAAKVLHVDINLLTVALKIKDVGTFILPISDVRVKVR